MMSIAECMLLDVLRAETCGNGSVVSLSIDVLQDVMDLAKEHAVLGVVANAALHGRVDIEPHPKKMQAVMALVQQCKVHEHIYCKFQAVVDEFAALMADNHLSYVVFKGLAVAALYPAPSERTMGDVDFYVPQHDFDRAVAVIESSWHLKIEKEDIDKHYAFAYKGIRFEMHYQVVTFGNARHQAYFNRLIDASIRGGVEGFKALEHEVSALSPIVNLIVVFKHWFNHLLVEGVGLRQTLDLAVLLQAYSDQIDAEVLLRHLSFVGYSRAFRAMVAMQERYFGLTCAGNYCQLTKLDYYFGDKLIEAVLESGNFGRRAYDNCLSGIRKSVVTAKRGMEHCFKFFWLAPWDILCLVPKRIAISLDKNQLNN